MTSQQISASGPPSGPGVAGVLARFRRDIAGMTATMWAARDRDELMDTLAEIEALKSTLVAVELGVVRELDATGAVKSSGWASTQDFLTAIAGGTKATGPSMVRLAASVDQPAMSPIGAAMGDGWLSTAKARVIERAVDALPGDPDLRARGVQALLAEARALDATELQKLAWRLLTVVDPDGDDRRAERELDRLERVAHTGRFLTITDDLAGGAWIKGRCSIEDAALVKATLIPLSAPHPIPLCDPATCRTPGCGHEGRDPRDHGARMLDALTEGCRLLQSADLLPESHAATPRLTLTMDLKDLLDQSGLGVTETGEQLTASVVRRLCCDANVIPAVLGAAAEVLDVGRSQRLVTAAIWKALVARDRHCRFRGCTRPPIMCHGHHIVHWADGGPTSLDNMVLLCGHHHRLVHAGPWRIRRTSPTGLVFDPPPGVHRRAGRPPPDDD